MRRLSGPGANFHGEYMIYSEECHVLPIKDLREHEASIDCWCKPKEDEGVIIHNSMDRREEYENGRLKS